MTAYEVGIKVTATDGASSVISKIQQGVGGFQERMAKFGLSAAGIQQVGASLSSVTDAFKNYESDLAAVSAVTGLAGKELDNIGNAARGLAKDFGGSASDQLKGFQGVLSKFGADQFKSSEGAKSLEQISRNINTLSAASGDSAAQSMDVLANAMLQMGVNTDDAAIAAKTSTEYINTLAASAQVGSAEIPQVGAAFLQVGVAAKGLNMDFNEVNTAIQVLGKGGKYGSEAGVALRNVLGLMMKASGPAEETLAKLGTSSAELGKIITDPSKGLNEAMKLLNKGLSTLGSDADRSAAKMTIFGAENAAAAGVLMANTESYDNYRKAIKESAEQGAAFTQAEIRMATASSFASRAQAYFNDLLITAGSAIGKYGVAAVDTFNSITPTLTGLAGLKAIIPPGAFSAIGTGATAAFGVMRTGAVSAMGAITPHFAGLRTMMGAVSFSSLSMGGSLMGAIRGIIPAILSMNTAFLTSPVTWIALGIAGAAFLIYKNWGAISGYFKNLFDGIAGYISGFASGIMAAFETPWSILMEIKTAFQPIIDAIWNLFTPVQATGAAVGQAANQFAWLKDAGIVAGQYIGTAFRVVVTPILWVVKVIGQTIGLMTGLTQSGGNMARVLTGAFTAITAPIQVVMRTVWALFQFIQSLFSGASLKEAGIKLITSLWDGIKEMWGKLVDGAMGLIDGIKNLFSGKGSGAEQVKQQAQQVAKTEIPAAKVEQAKIPEMPEMPKPKDLAAPKVGTPKIPEATAPKLRPLNPPEAPDFSWIEKQNIKPPKIEPMKAPDIQTPSGAPASAGKGGSWLQGIIKQAESFDVNSIPGAEKVKETIDGIVSGVPSLTDVVGGLTPELPDFAGIVENSMPELPDFSEMASGIKPELPDVSGIAGGISLESLGISSVGGISSLGLPSLPSSVQELLKTAGIDLPKTGGKDEQSKPVKAAVKSESGGFTVNFTVNVNGDGAISQGADNIRRQVEGVLRDQAPELLLQIERAMNQSKRKMFDTL